MSYRFFSLIKIIYVSKDQYFDEETGLHYNRHRYYDPSLGQFTTQDPIGLVGGVNNYQYAPNPTGWVDPLGLTCKENTWNEFQQRAKSQFASSKIAAEAWGHFKNGRFAEMADLMDFSSRKNGAVFCSGNYPEAEKFAIALQKTVPVATTMEMTPGGSVFDGWEKRKGYFDDAECGAGTPKDERRLWAAISTKYAQNVFW